jgi:hypothetical protein
MQLMNLEKGQKDVMRDNPSVQSQDYSGGMVSG